MAKCYLWEDYPTVIREAQRQAEPRRILAYATGGEESAKEGKGVEVGYVNRVDEHSVAYWVAHYQKAAESLPGTARVIPNYDALLDTVRAQLTSSDGEESTVVRSSGAQPLEDIPGLASFGGGCCAVDFLLEPTIDQLIAQQLEKNATESITVAGAGGAAVRANSGTPAAKGGSSAGPAGQSGNANTSASPCRNLGGVGAGGGGGVISSLLSVVTKRTAVGEVSSASPRDGCVTNTTLNTTSNAATHRVNSGSHFHPLAIAGTNTNINTINNNVCGDASGGTPLTLSARGLSRSQPQAQSHNQQLSGAHSQRCTSPRPMSNKGGGSGVATYTWNQRSGSSTPRPGAGVVVGVGGAGSSASHYNYTSGGRPNAISPLNAGQSLPQQGSSPVQAALSINRAYATQAYSRQLSVGGGSGMGRSAGRATRRSTSQRSETSGTDLGASFAQNAGVGAPATSANPVQDPLADVKATQRSSWRPSTAQPGFVAIDAFLHQQLAAHGHGGGSTCIHDEDRRSHDEDEYEEEDYSGEYPPFDDDNDDEDGSSGSDMSCEDADLDQGVSGGVVVPLLRGDGRRRKGVEHRRRSSAAVDTRSDSSSPQHDPVAAYLDEQARNLDAEVLARHLALLSGVNNTDSENGHARSSIQREANLHAAQNASEEAHVEGSEPV